MFTQKWSCYCENCVKNRTLMAQQKNAYDNVKRSRAKKKESNKDVGFRLAEKGRQGSYRQNLQV